MFFQNLLTYTLILPLIGSFLLITLPFTKKKSLKQISLNISCLTFIFSIGLWVLFNKSVGIFQFVTKFLWIPAFNLNFIMA